jgi:murein DD-endopeptidase MepM/ murein hydrolase activator NlpD
MTQTIWTKAGVFAVSALTSALGLSACATPTYPIKAGYTPPAPIRPQYAASAQQAQTTAPAPAGAPASDSPPPAADTSGAAPVPSAQSSAAQVESQPLPPASGSAVASPATASPPPAVGPSPAPVPSPAQSALPPDYTPPSPAPEAPPPLPAPAPPQAYRSPPTSYNAPYSAPQVRYRPAPARYAAGGKVVAATGMFRDYEVQKHDHLDAIARDLATTRKVLVDANHLKAPYDLQPGQHLKVPVAKAYVIESGDTMSEVAKRFGVSPSELADLNDLPVRGRLRPGDRLALPANFDDRGPTKLPSTMVAETTYAPQPPAARPTYRTQASSEPSGGPYVPSPAALAAAQRLAIARSYGPPTYVPGRPSPNAGIPPRAPRPYAYTPPAVTQSAPALSQAAVTQAGQGRFIWPVRGEIISGFGATGVGRRNDGVDVKSPQGTVVRAAAAGNVVYAGDQVPGFGNLVLVKHADGWVTAYAHLDRVSVQMRQTVTQGQELGAVGQTGGVGEPQLHFEVRYAPTATDKAKPVDPLLVLPK